MMTNTLFLVALLSSAAEPSVPVQRPESAPSESEPDAPAVEAEPSSTIEAAETSGPPTLPEPEVQPSPEPAPEPPPPVVETTPQPATTVAAPTLPQGDAAIVDGAAGPDDPAGPYDGYVRVTRPRTRGTGMLGTAIGLWGFAALYQIGDRLVCGGCATGFFEHALLGTAVGLAAGGGARRGAALAYDDAVLGRKPRDATKFRRVGLGLLVGGAVLTIVNDALFYSCWVNGDGPYDGDTTYCSHGISRSLLDLGTGSMGVGAAMLAGGTRYAKHWNAYSRGRVFSVTPSFGPSMAGMRVGGRF